MPPRASAAQAGGARRAPDTVKQLGVPALGPRPRHRPSGVLAPLALEPDLVAREHHRHTGHRHLQSDADELPLARAGDGAEPRGVVAVEDRPRVEHAIQGTPARKRRIVSTSAVPGKRGIGTGRPRNSVASSPGRSSPRSQVHTGRVKPAYAIVPCQRPPEGRRGRRAHARRRRSHPAERRRRPRRRLPRPRRSGRGRAGGRSCSRRRSASRRASTGPRASAATTTRSRRSAAGAPPSGSRASGATARRTSSRSRARAGRRT